MVRKYTDEKFHASDAEAVFSQIKEAINKSFDDKGEAARMIAVAEKAFELGFQTATEYYENRKLEELKKYSELEPDALKKVFEVEKLLIDSYNKIDVDDGSDREDE